MQHGVAFTLTGTSGAFTLNDIVARNIADFLEKYPSTISREIQKHSLVKIPNSCDCNDYNGCNVKHVCGSTSSCNGYRSSRFKLECCIYFILPIMSSPKSFNFRLFFKFLPRKTEQKMYDSHCILY